MNIQIKLFASLREFFAAAVIERELAPGATVADLLTQLRSEIAGRPAPATLHVAVNQRYAEPDHPLAEGDVVAIFPPVSGGEAARRFWITAEPLSLDELAALVTAPDRGAVALFSGTVRGLTGAQATDHLEYEAYAEMAVQTLAQIGQEVRQRWPQVCDIAIVHRVGRLRVGESSVMVAVAAGHRGGVFDACAYAIERLKQIAPIWKKEVGPDGTYWVEGPAG